MLSPDGGGRDGPSSPNPLAQSSPLRVVPTSPAEGPAYVEREAVSLQHFVNRYIRTRGRPVNQENRLTVQQAIEMYEGRFPAACADLEAFLDSLLLDRTSKP